jgi:hypothetical protein
MAGSAAVVEGDGTTLMPEEYRRTRSRSNAGLETEGRSFSDWQPLREPLWIAVPGGYPPHSDPLANEPLKNLGGELIWRKPAPIPDIRTRIVLLLGKQPSMIGVFGPHVRSFTLGESEGFGFAIGSR